MTATILTGDVIEQLRTLPDNSVQCVVTSPPYYGLRNYGVPGQIGLEATPAAYVARMVEVFREVRRVLREDGVCWLNLGDSYNGSGGAGGDYNAGGLKDGQPRYPGRNIDTLKPKDLIGIPWRVAFALQEDGWWLRSDIIWAKPNPMPESVTDRPTKSHEYIFLLTKSARYFYDSDAIREEPQSRPKAATEGYHSDQRRQDDMEKYGMSRGGNGLYGSVATTHPNGRNARTVWTIATQPYPEAHFATFPEELPRRCIMAGTSAHGCCPECGAPWVRETERTAMVIDHSNNHPPELRTRTSGTMISPPSCVTTGWRPTCDHDAAPIPCTILDPFAGSGTTLAVALALGRNAIGIELNPEYVKLAERRLAGITPALFGV